MMIHESPPPSQVSRPAPPFLPGHISNSSLDRANVTLVYNFLILSFFSFAIRSNRHFPYSHVPRGTPRLFQPAFPQNSPPRKNTVKGRSTWNIRRILPDLCCIPPPFYAKVLYAFSGILLLPGEGDFSGWTAEIRRPQRFRLWIRGGVQPPRGPDAASSRW